MSPMCPDAKTMDDFIWSFQFIKAAVCPYVGPAGFVVIGMIVWGAVSTGIYLRTGSVLMPVVLFLLTGGAITATMSSVALQLATIALLVTGGGVFAYAYYRFGR